MGMVIPKINNFGVCDMLFLLCKDQGVSILRGEGVVVRIGFQDVRNVQVTASVE